MTSMEAGLQGAASGAMKGLLLGIVVMVFVIAAIIYLYIKEKVSKVRKLVSPIRSENDELYAKALAEVKNDQVVKGLWAHCFAKADGDKDKATALYIKLRAEQLEKEVEESQVVITPISTTEISDSASKSKEYQIRNWLGWLIFVPCASLFLFELYSLKVGNDTEKMPAPPAVVEQSVPASAQATQSTPEVIAPTVSDADNKNSEFYKHNMVSDNNGLTEWGKKDQNTFVCGPSHFQISTNKKDFEFKLTGNNSVNTIQLVYVDDFFSYTCLQSSNLGNLLLFQHKCGGSACRDLTDYYGIIGPETLKVLLVPTEDNREMAEAIIGYNFGDKVFN